jgi:subtilisin family serine protease
MGGDEINFIVQDSLGNPVRADVLARVRTLGGDELYLDAVSDGEGLATFLLPPLSRIEYVVAASRQPGFWNLFAEDVDDFEELVLQSLPAIDEPAWWLECLGIDSENPDRGKGIKIGVVDGDFRNGAGLEHVVQLMATGQPEPPDGWGHGEAVCRILADREARVGRLLSIAPAAQVVFIDASNENDTLNEDAATIAIRRLVVEEKVDIINLSWGNASPNDAIRDVLNLAAEFGVTVVAATGNEGFQSQPMYPASDPNCIGVGALGLDKWGPVGTLVEWYRKRSNDVKRQGNVPRIGQVYAWCDSTIGAGIHVLAPGVGIFVQRDGGNSFELSGTSFASPMVCGLLAVALAADKQYLGLPRSRGRTNYVRQAFKSMCRPVGISKRYQGSGVPSAP